MVLFLFHLSKLQASLLIEYKQLADYAYIFALTCPCRNSFAGSLPWHFSILLVPRTLCILGNSVPLKHKVSPIFLIATSLLCNKRQGRHMTMLIKNHLTICRMEPHTYNPSQEAKDSGIQVLVSTQQVRSLPPLMKPYLKKTKPGPDVVVYSL